MRTKKMNNDRIAKENKNPHWKDYMVESFTDENSIMKSEEEKIMSRLFSPFDALYHFGMKVESILDIFEDYDESLSQIAACSTARCGPIYEFDQIVSEGMTPNLKDHLNEQLPESLQKELSKIDEPYKADALITILIELEKKISIHDNHSNTLENLLQNSVDQRALGSKSNFSERCLAFVDELASKIDLTSLTFEVDLDEDLLLNFSDQLVDLEIGWMAMYGAKHHEICENSLDFIKPIFRMLALIDHVDSNLGGLTVEIREHYLFSALHIFRLVFFTYLAEWQAKHSIDANIWKEKHERFLDSKGQESFTLNDYLFALSEFDENHRYLEKYFFYQINRSVISIGEGKFMSIKDENTIISNLN